MGWVHAGERLSLIHLGKASRGNAKVKTGIGKSDLSELQGGPRKPDFVVLTRCAPRLYPDLQPMKPGRSDLTLSTVAFPDLTQRPQLTNHASAGLM